MGGERTEADYAGRVTIRYPAEIAVAVAVIAGSVLAVVNDHETPRLAALGWA